MINVFVPTTVTFNHHHTHNVTMKLEQVAQNKAFGGSLTKYKFVSEAFGGLETHFNLSVHEGRLRPPSTLSPSSFPTRHPEELKSPPKTILRTLGTGFYCNATSSDWSKHYSMENLITSEIQRVLKEDSGVGDVLDLDRQSVMGHSMGGHGAITLYLKGVLGARDGVEYHAASGFAPILNPTKCPWGDKAFKGYLKGELEEGKAHDATELIAQAKGKSVQILADYGTADNFYKVAQLLPENLLAASKDARFGSDTVNVREREGYDHSYYFVSTFVPEPITSRHALILKK
ncbi:unnamed protein product [Rhizoctonia solani]|uniref:S-formylglutathione hydrolase n=1 Tax=Rhizoctonia solani TaxID=456999 RepID=A0A8H3DRT1_9AGAM|nr:unnamed protein product [Rhizoctonia solani]